MLKRHSEQTELIVQLETQASKRQTGAEPDPVEDPERPLAFNSVKLTDEEKVKTVLANGYLESLYADREFCRRSLVIREFDALNDGRVLFRLGKLDSSHYRVPDISLTHYGFEDEYPIYSVAENFDETPERDRLATLDKINKAIEVEVEKTGRARALIQEIKEEMVALFGEEYESKAQLSLAIPHEMTAGVHFRYVLTPPNLIEEFMKRAPGLLGNLKEMRSRSEALLKQGQAKIDRLLSKK